MLDFVVQAEATAAVIAGLLLALVELPLLVHQRSFDCLFGLKGVNGTVFHIGNIHTCLSILAVDIEGPVLAVLVPIQSDSVDGLHIQAVIALFAID